MQRSPQSGVKQKNRAWKQGVPIQQDKIHAYNVIVLKFFFWHALAYPWTTPFISALVPLSWSLPSQSLLLAPLLAFQSFMFGFVVTHHTPWVISFILLASTLIHMLWYLILGIVFPVASWQSPLGYTIGHWNTRCAKWNSSFFPESIPSGLFIVIASDTT